MSHFTVAGGGWSAGILGRSQLLAGPGLNPKLYDAQPTIRDTAVKSQRPDFRELSPATRLHRVALRPALEFLSQEPGTVPGGGPVEL